MLHRYRSMYTGVKYKAAVRLASCVPSSLRSTQRSAWKSHKQTAVSKLCALFDDEDSEAEQFAPYWGQQKTDWEDPPDEQDELADIWYEGNASPEDLAQNALAVALSALLVWGIGSILFKLVIVSYALFAAAFRYSFVALVLLVVVVFLAA